MRHSQGAGESEPVPIFMTLYSHTLPGKTHIAQWTKPLTTIVIVFKHEAMRITRNGRNSPVFGVAAAAAKSLQSCPTLCDPIDVGPPGSPTPGILQARTLGWVTISFSNSSGLGRHYCRNSFELNLKDEKGAKVRQKEVNK